MRRIDEQYTACLFYGSRRLTAWLVVQGEEVNRNRVQRLSFQVIELRRGIEELLRVEELRVNFE